jgi:ribonuclease HI
MAIIATDGSCKRNGKPDCISSYAIVVWVGDKEYEIVGYEYESTSQRGELMGIRHALEIGKKLIEQKDEEEIYLITDSEYARKAIYYKWFDKWSRNGWKTSSGSDVKNKDLWQDIMKLVDSYDEDTLHIFQVKGHVNVNNDDKVREAMLNFIDCNNGVKPPRHVLITFLSMNNKADKLAKEYVEEINEIYLNNIADNMEPTEGYSWK